MKMLDKHQEPQNVCGSCWYYDAIENSRFEVVMYCYYHEVACVDYEICDEYENAAIMERRRFRAKGRE